MIGTPRALGIVALTASLGVALFAACGGPTRSSEPPMAGSAAILPSPVNAEIVPKSTPSATTIPPSTHGTGKAGELDQGEKPPAEIVLAPAASASASTTKADDKKCPEPNGKTSPGKTKKGAPCSSDKECVTCVCTSGICSRPGSADL